MNKNVIDLALYRQPIEVMESEAEAEAVDMLAFFRSLPLPFTRSHCAKARGMLAWSVEALAFRSGVSVQAIKQFEAGERDLLRVSVQALAYALEAQGLVFIPGHDPMKGGNARGATENPRERSDYHLME